MRNSLRVIVFLWVTAGMAFGVLGYCKGLPPRKCLEIVGAINDPVLTIAGAFTLWRLFDDRPEDSRRSA